MEQDPIPGKPLGSVINVFKNGTLPSKEAYTGLWIRLIRQLEQPPETHDFPGKGISP